MESDKNSNKMKKILAFYTIVVCIIMGYSCSNKGKTAATGKAETDVAIMPK